jgi:hypothetical protein
LKNWFQKNNFVPTGYDLRARQCDSGKTTCSFGQLDWQQSSIFGEILGSKLIIKIGAHAYNYIIFFLEVIGLY